MALFFSAEAKEQPATDIQADLVKVRVELKWTKDAARIRAEHGSKLTDPEVDQYLAEEADMVVRRVKAKEADEINRQNEIKLDNAYRDLACELVKKGSMLISVDGKRIKTLTPDLLILCPECGKKLDGLSAAIYELAKMWYWQPDPETRINSFIVYNARNPLGSVIGVMAHDARVCPHCREHIGGFLQVVLV
jgi:RNase P subunit RPR2